jgi:hypothetical protein
MHRYIFLQIRPFNLSHLSHAISGCVLRTTHLIKRAASGSVLNLGAVGPERGMLYQDLQPWFTI